MLLLIDSTILQSDVATNLQRDDSIITVCTVHHSLQFIFHVCNRDWTFLMVCDKNLSGYRDVQTTCQQVNPINITITAICWQSFSKQKLNLGPVAPTLRIVEVKA